MESWKPVVGYEGLYEVSDEGRVRSLERMVPNGPNSYRVVQTRILKAVVDFHGYPNVQLSRENRARKLKVHNLVLEAFVGPRPGRCVAMHADDNKTNNRLVNLSWGTQRENIRQAYERGRMHTNRVGSLFAPIPKGS